VLLPVFQFNQDYQIKPIQLPILWSIATKFFGNFEIYVLTLKYRKRKYRLVELNIVS